MTQNTETQAVLDLVTRLQHVSMDLGVPSTTTLNSKVVAEVADTLRALLAERDAARTKLTALEKAVETKGGGPHAPTEWAYLKVCEALDKAKASSIRARAEVAVLREALEAFDPNAIGSGPSTDMSKLHDAQMTARQVLIALKKV